jgi:DNA repair exonuclease SbcCD ATPase subunit
VADVDIDGLFAELRAANSRAIELEARVAELKSALDAADAKVVASLYLESVTDAQLNELRREVESETSAWDLVGLRELLLMDLEQMRKAMPALIRRSNELPGLSAALDEARFRIAELETQLAERTCQLENVLDASREGMWMARALDAEREHKAASAQLAEREGLERKLAAFLRASCCNEAHALFDNDNQCFSVRLERKWPLSPFFGEASDYWQALRAALDEAEKGKT